MNTLIITQPDDFHLHVRDGQALKAVVPFTARQMGRALIMPNLKPPVSTPEQGLAYKREILAAVPAGLSFEPLMALYLTDNTTVEIVKAAKEAGIVAFKLYPAGATTNSDFGVTDIFKLIPVLEEMASLEILLLVHGEVVDSNIDIFDREAVFIERVLQPLMKSLPELKIVFEHITTAQAAQLVKDSGDNLAASVTPQHLMFNRNTILVGGIKPHFYCLPILKREKHRMALIEAISSEKSHKFFLGTDSAPHAKHLKECACGCAGMFSAHAAIELYAEIFDQANALDKLEAFSSQNGARFYGMAQNKRKIRLEKKIQTIPESYVYGSDRLVPMCAGENISWTMVEILE